VIGLDGGSQTVRVRGQRHRLPGGSGGSTWWSRTRYADADPDPVVIAVGGTATATVARRQLRWVPLTVQLFGSNAAVFTTPLYAVFAANEAQVTVDLAVWCRAKGC